MSLDKFRVERNASIKHFICPICLKSRTSDKKVSRIIFGRRRWYDICAICVKPKDGAIKPR